MIEAEIQVEIRHEEEDLHETEQYFDLVDLDEHDDGDITSTIIKEKEAKIKELQTNLNWSKFFIDFLEQENQQLKTKHVIDEVKFIKAQREPEKAKIFLEEALETYGVTEEPKYQVTRRRPRTRGLKRALELERQKEVELANQLTLNEKFAVVINDNREQWIDRDNQNLEKLLEKENRDNDVLRRKSKHYAQRDKIARAKLKRANAKIEALTMKEEEIRLDILV